MANTRCLAAIVGAMLAVTSTADAREDDSRPVVRIHVENYAGIAPSIVEGAAHELAHIYEAAGITVAWTTGAGHADCALTLTIHVLLMSLGMEDRLARGTRVGSKVLAQANREARRVYVFWSRVDGHVSRTTAPLSDALGYVIAHELGHVLLPSGGHSPTGIMQKNYMVHASHLQRFTTDQSTAMRAFVSATAHQR